MTQPADEPVITLVELDEERFQRLTERANALQNLATQPNRTRLDVEYAADKAQVHPSTIYRNLRQLEGVERITTRALIPLKAGYPRGRSRLHPQVERIIDDQLNGYHLTQAKPSMLRTYGRIVDACAELELSPPSRATVIRRLNRINRRRRELRRNGRKAAEAATPRHGRFDVRDARAVYQVDHTLADVIIVDSKHRKPIGRPWLTLVIDVATRMVAGYYVSLEPPSILRAGVAVEFAVRDKTDWLKVRGYDYPWPVCGLPGLVHTDRGSDFRAHAFERALQNQGVDTFLRPAGRPHWGGHIERLIGTMMGACRMLPGATHGNPSARGNYDSVASARLDLSQIDGWFAHQILGVYHDTVHSALGRTPLEAWAELTEGRVPRFPDDTEVFRLDLLPSIERLVTRHGIRAFGQDYACEELKVAFAAGVRKVEVKFDPRDLSQLWVRLERDRFVIVPYRFEIDPGRAPTLALHKALTRASQEERGRLHGEFARRAMARIEADLEAGATTSTRARRMHERLVDARRATAAPVVEDDTWEGSF